MFDKYNGKQNVDEKSELNYNSKEKKKKGGGEKKRTEITVLSDRKER